MAGMLPFQFSYLSLSYWRFALLSDPCLCDRIQDYLLEESVCLLLKANWFRAPDDSSTRGSYDEHEEYYLYEEDDDGMDDFLSQSGFLQPSIGNPEVGKQWLCKGPGVVEARLLSNEGFQQDLGSSYRTNKGNKVEIGNGRRAKRAMEARSCG
ncbi:hypothetical protein Scep_013890 [Stephania cephalantha]|uniref:Uncharacterized protein n=1 Tax=Stephania cephalantha TaxID=152367 RepID=A0AAP0J097_9MAGN